MKSFNTSVACVPEKHYMVDMTGRVNQIIDSLIRENKYFTIGSHDLESNGKRIREVIV
ncbi:MAG: hypothetical protein LUG93_10910 [Lachnospiraceae bacterium]|nr:hypothetical protein [Lachnospiraceae bacterium]